MANEFVNKVIVNGETKLDLTGDTVTPDSLLQGVTAHDSSGNEITGTMKIPSMFVSQYAPWGISGNTAKFDNIAAPDSVSGDFIYFQGYLYNVTSHVSGSSISVTLIGNTVAGVTGSPYIVANNSGWGISGDNRSFDRSQLNPNTPVVGGIVYSPSAGMYFKINTVSAATISVTTIYKDLVTTVSERGRRIFYGTSSAEDYYAAEGLTPENGDIYIKLEA